jgi:flagellar hook-length control protein FliK
MLTTRAIAAGRAGSEAMRRGDAAIAPDAAGDSFLAALDMAAGTADRPRPGGTTAPADDRDAEHGVAAATLSPATAQSTHNERPHRPPPAVGDPVAAPGAAVDRTKSSPPPDGSPTGAAPGAAHKADPRHPPPSALGAMLLLVPPIQGMAVPNFPGSGASASELQLPGEAGATIDRDAAAGELARVSLHATADAQCADGAAAPQRDAAAQVSPPDAAARTASPDAGGDTLLPATAADATGPAHRPLSDNLGQASQERVPALGPAPQGAITIGVAVQPIAMASGRGAPERLAAGAEDGGSGIGVAATLAGAGAGGAVPAATTSPSTTPASPPDGGAAGLAQQVATGLAGALATGRLDVVLRLHPPELGELNVRVQVTGREVSAWFDAPLPQVQQALGQGMEQLQVGLAAAGYNLNGAWIGGDAWTPRGWTAPPAPRPARAAPDGQVAPSPGAPSSTAGSGVSLYV